MRLLNIIRQKLGLAAIKNPWPSGMSKELIRIGNKKKNQPKK